MKNRFMKRGLSLLLAVAMMFGMIQAPLFTQEVEAASSSMLSLVETPTAGNDYAMVAKLSDGTYRALVNNSGTASTQEVTVSGTDAPQLSLNGNASVDNLKWNLSVSGFTTDLGGYWIKNDTQYLYLNFNDWTTIASGSDTSTTTANVEITTDATTAYRYVRLSGSASAHWDTNNNLQNTVISVGGLEIYDVNNSALTYTADDIVVSGTSQDSGDQVSKSDVLTATATEFWSSEVRSATDKIAQGNPYFMVDLQTAQNIGKVNYIPRLAGSNNYNCVGRIYDYYVDASNGEQKAVLSTTSTECDLTAVADTTGAYYISAGNQKLAYDETAQAFTFNETGTPIYFYEVSEGSETIESITMGKKPANGTTQNQPFARGTAGSDKFRIPALITTKDGTLVAAIDARWNTYRDARGIDTIVSTSTDDGANWNYTFANYLGDYGNESADEAAEKIYAATFIDPELIYDPNAGDKGTVYMLVDLYAGGYAINSAIEAPVSGDPFTDAGYLKLKASGASTYDYYLKEGKIYETDGTEVSGYTVDGHFNLFYNDAEAGNLFFNSADQAKKPAYQVYPTTYLYLTKSTDNGATWSEPQLLDVKADDEYFYGVGPGRGIVTSDGTLMFSCYKYAGSEESQKASVIYSTDNGATWKRTQNATPSIWSSESQLVELPDGTIRMFFRNGQGCICYVDATKGTDADGNKVYTWGDYKTTSITNRSNCQLSAMMYSKKIDGKDAILVACPSNTSSRSEGKIFVALLNSDNSMEWKYNYAGFGTGYFQYSCMTELTDGSIGILYEDCSTTDGSAVYKKIAITDIVGDATIGGFWVEDVTGNVVTDVTMKPGDTATYSIFGETAGSLSVLSSNTDVATVALNETATAAADDAAVATFTVTANADLVGYGTSTITVSDGTESTSFKVEVVSGDTENYEIVKLKVDETATFQDKTGYYVGQETGVDSSKATVELTGVENPQVVVGQLATERANNFNGAYVDIDDCLYTFTSTGTDNVYTISATTANGTTVYLNLDEDVQLPNKQNASKEITLYAGSTDGTVVLYDKSAGDSGSSLHFHKSDNNHHFNRCSDNGGSRAEDAEHQFEIYKQSSSVENSNIKGYEQVKSLSDITEGKYLIVAEDDGVRYILYPYAGDPNNNYNHVAKYTSSGYFEQAVGVADDNGYADNTVGISNCLYTFGEGDAEGYYVISSKDVAGNEVYLNLNTTERKPNQDTKADIDLQYEASSGTFRLYDVNAVATSGAVGVYLHFRDGDVYFDRCSSDGSCGNKHKFLLLEPSETVTDSQIIPGYVQVSSVGAGKQYLIAHYDETKQGYYLLNPYSGGTVYNHVAKLTSQKVETTSGTTDITITGVAPGETTAVIGDTTYYITVTEDEKVEKVTLRVGETYEVEGKLISQEDGQNILSVEKKMLAPYVLADTIESGESYLIQSVVDSNKYVGYVQGETTSSGTTVSGLALGKENNEDLNSTDYHNYAWTITGSEENGYVIQNAEGNYMAIGESNSDHASVTLSTDPVSLKIYKNTRTDQYAGAYGISNSGNNKHLNNANDGYAIAYTKNCDAGARSNWKLYKSTNAKVVLTAETVGQTVMEIGDTTYYFTVIDDDPVKSYSLAVGEVAPVIVSGELSGYDEAEKAIAKIEVVDGNMTIEGLSAGYVQIKVGAVTYNIVVAPKAEGFPIVAESGSGYTDLAAGEALKVVTKLTISDNNTFDLGVNEGTNVTWTSGDENILTVDANGVITCKDVTTTVITTVTATVDGVDYTIPVIVHPGPTTNGNKLVDIYIDEISNLNVYYSWNCSTDLIHACTGEAIYYSANVDDPLAIDFMSAPTDGYALTYMAATNGQGHYMTVHTGDDATLDESAKGFLNYVGSDGAAGAGVTQKTLFTEAQVKAMLYAGIVRHCDGAMGFTRTSDATGQIASSLTFQAEKLPTIEKSVHGILPADARRPGYRTYEDGMAATEGEFVYFQITLKTYRPLTFKEGTTQSMINYDAAVLTDDVLEGASFITDKGQETVLTPDQIIPSPVITTIEDIEDALNAQEWADGEVTKELTYYVAYKIAADDIGSTLKNTAELSYNYQAEYSTGGYSAAANAEAQLTVADYIEKELVVDFGLPVSMTLPTWGKVAKTEGDANAQSDYDVIRLETGSGEGIATATYGTVTVEEVLNTAQDTTTGWKVTYTPTQTLKATDVITLYSSNVFDENNNPAAYTIKVYPASSVYYEENFIDTSKDTDGDTTNSEWTIAGTAMTAEQEAAQPGYTTALQNATANYGYDAAYADAANSEIVTATTETGKEKAAFTFSGTGVDVFANCDAETGIVMVMVKQVGEDGTQTLKKMYTVDTKLNLGTIDNAATLGDATLNVPIVSIPANGLDYGDYEVLLVHAPKKVKTQTTVDGVATETITAVATDLRIDGFRVYGTLQDPDAAIVHGKDLEAAPVYLDMKDSILAGMSVSDAWAEGAGENKTAYAEQLAGNLLSQIYASSGAKLTGAVVTASDSKTLTYSGADLKDFLDNTSKNELYLYPGQSLVFALDFSTMNPQLALKALNGDAAYSITKKETGNDSATAETETKELKANTEMYYLLGMLKNADKTQLATTFTISNTGTSVISVTKLKVITGAAVEAFVELSAEDLVPAFSVVKNGDAGEKENVVRIAGEDRYETAYLVAEEYKEVLGVEKFDAVIVATGKNFADALSGSYLASVKNAPILLTNGKEDNVAQLHAYIKDNVAEGGVVYILGGTAAVPESVEAIEGYDPVRLAGETRYETNLAILDEAGLDNSELLIATGRTFADSLSASALKKPIMLVKDEVTENQEAVLAQYIGGRICIIGGTGAVSEDIENALAQYGTVRRVYGQTRYETSIAVADEFFRQTGMAVIANAQVFPDGLCGGPLAGALNAPLILTADGKTADAAAYMQDKSLQNGIVLGGDARISDDSVGTIFGISE